MKHIFKAIVGSQSYGTSIPTSDVDYKGIFLASQEDLNGFTYKEQIEVGKDECYYEIRRFLQLAQSEVATKNNISIIIDNCHTKDSYLQEWIKKKPNNYSLRMIFFDIPIWKAYILNILRWMKNDKFIPFSVINAMKKNYDKIDKKKYEHIF